MACVSNKSFHTHFPVFPALYSLHGNSENYLKFTWKTLCLEMYRVYDIIK